MKKLVSLFLILLGTGLFAAAQDSGVTSKRLNFAYIHGNPDYVDLSSLGSNVFQAGVNEPMVKAKNLKSFAANFRGWRLVDEYIVDPEFFWELDPVALKGNIRTVNYEKISKYPSLVKRYKAIRPVGVNYIVCVDLDSVADESGTSRVHQTCFRAQSYQMFWGASRSGRAASYPGALLGWKEGVSTASAATRFTAGDNSDVTRLKNIVSKFRAVSKYSGLATNTWLDIRWPDEAIDQIYEDFEEYEKKGKDLEKEYKEAKEEPKVAKRSQPLPADDEMAQPYESAVKTAVAFSDNAEAGLKSKAGRTIFSTNEYRFALQLDKEGSFFRFDLKNPNPDVWQRRMHFRKASGRKLKLNSYDEFWGVIKHEDLYSYDKWHPQKGLVPVGSSSVIVDLPGGTVYTSVLCTEDPAPVDPENLSRFVEGQAKRRKEIDEERRKEREYEARTGKRVLNYSWGGDLYKFEYRQGVRIIVDSKFKVIREQPVLVPFRGAKC